MDYNFSFFAPHFLVKMKINILIPTKVADSLLKKTVSKKFMEKSVVIEDPFIHWKWVNYNGSIA